MQEKETLQLDLIYTKISFVVALLASYNSLDLSKGIKKINNGIDSIKKSIIDNKEYIDIRDVIELRNELETLKGRLKNDKDVPLEGHKIACLLFEVKVLIELYVLEASKISEDMKEYLTLSSNYLYTCGKIINEEILCY